MEKFSESGPFDSLTRINKDGRVEMKLEGDWFSVSLSTWPGRMAARMWAFASICEGPEHETLAKAVLDEVGREEHKG